MNQLTSIQKLFEEIQARASEVTSRDGKTPLVTILIQAFLDAMEEIRLGADFDEFSDLAILNLIIRGDKEGYTTAELRAFVDSLQGKGEQ